MINNFANQPVAILKSYLDSVVPALFLDFKTKGLESSEVIEAKVLKNLELQAASASASGADKFPVVINITFPIIKYSTWSMPGTQFFIRLFKSLERDERISGVLFNIDSGGGMVAGTGEFCSVIENSSLPTIAYTNGYMCSAAYEIASACDARVAHPDADLIGSIGTMLSYQDYSAMFEKWGATIYEVYAPQSTEKNREFRELKKGNKKLYEERLKVLTDDFIGRVKSNLGDKIKDDGHVFKGKTYRPKEALKIGLVDEIGTLEDALLNF